MDKVEGKNPQAEVAKTQNFCNLLLHMHSISDTSLRHIAERTCNW